MRTVDNIKDRIARLFHKYTRDENSIPEGTSSASSGNFGLASVSSPRYI